MSNYDNHDSIGQIEWRKIFYTHYDTNKDDLVKQIDLTGGWPPWATCLISYHNISASIDRYDKKPRQCYFGTVFLYDDWNTMIMKAEHYYWRKVPREMKLEYARGYAQGILTNYIRMNK